MITQNKNLNLVPGGIPQIINVSQYDKGQTLTFDLYNQGSPFTIPTGAEVSIQGTKPDNHGFAYSCTFSGSIVTAILQQQMTAVAGDVLTEIAISKSGNLIATANFILRVEKAALGDDTVISDTEIPEIIELATQQVEDAEAWANGTRNGVPVDSSDPAFHNNSYFWSQQPKAASEITYDNTQSGLPSTNAQGAIDDLKQTLSSESVESNTPSFNTVTGGKLSSLVVAINPIQVGTGTPSPSNQRRIYGHSSINTIIGSSGKNLCPYITEGLIDATTGLDIYGAGTYRSGYIKVEQGKSYTISGFDVGGVRFFKYDENGTFISPSWVSEERTLTVRSWTGYLRFQFGSDKYINDNVQVEEGSTATSYVPYNGKEIIVKLGNQYYSGTLDLVSGKLLVNYVCKVLGDLSWTYNDADNNFYSDVSVSDAKYYGNYGNGICENYFVNNVSGRYMTDGGFKIQIGRIYIKDTRYSDAATFKTAIAEVKLVYELATPQIIQLTPTEVETLIGENELSAPATGQTIQSYEYRSVMAWDDVDEVIDGLAQNSYVNGAVNLAPNYFTSQTQSGITAVTNSDGTVTINGTSTADVAVNVIHRINNPFTLPVGKYRVSGLPISAVGSARLMVNYTDSTNSGIEYCNDYGYGAEFEVKESDISQYFSIGFNIMIPRGKTFNNAVFKPMITLADMPNSDYDHYVPHAKSNKELTQDIDEINSRLGSIDYDGAGAHNSIYRGKYLGMEVTAEQYTAISSGKFTDLYIGDYWTIGGVNYRIAAFDYWYNTGDTACTTHHVVIVPDTKLADGKINSTNTTAGGYAGSDLKTGNNSNTALETARNTVISAFGSAHILSHREYFTNAVAKGKPSAGGWYDSDVDLMNENMTYGTNIFLSHSDGSTVPNLNTIDKTQLKLFAERPDLITIRTLWWLRDVVSAESFASVHDHGYAFSANTSYSRGVRPAFAIKA